MSDNQKAQTAMANEVCRGCHGPNTVQADEDIPLCSWHWNAWLARYLGADDQPCPAHLIRPTP